MANRVTMSICGTEYILVAEEDAAYMEKIGSMVDAEMQKLMDSAHMSRDAAAVLAAVNLADYVQVFSEYSRKADFVIHVTISSDFSSFMTRSVSAAASLL